MTRLTPSEYTLLLDCIGGLHTMPDLPTLRVWLLEEALPRLIAADWYSYNEVDLLAPETIALLRPDDDAALRLLPAWTAHAHEHPLVTHAATSGDPGAVKISDFLSRAAYRRLGIYGEVYRPLGVEFQIASPIEADERHVTALALSRRQRDFRERDRTLLEHLRPQMAQAFRNLRAARAALRQGADATAALETLNGSAVVITSAGRILRHAGTGTARLAAYFRTGAQDRVLPESLRAWVQGQLARPSALTPGVPFVQFGDRGSLAFRLAPLPTPGEWLVVLQEQHALDWEAALRPLGFSRREGEVARWLAEGKSNRDIGSILGISPRTVQKHLERIFARLGVEKRTVAIACLLEQVGTWCRR